MTEKTPWYKWPFPSATDRVRDGYQAMANLASAVENTIRNIDQPWASVYAGQISIINGADRWIEGSQELGLYNGGFGIFIEDGDITVQRAGWYYIHAHVNVIGMSEPQSVGIGHAFVGDGSTRWIYGNLTYRTPAAQQSSYCVATVDVMTTQHLNGLDRVRWGLMSENVDLWLDTSILFVRQLSTD